MKKYLSLFVVLSMAFIISAQNVKAEDSIKLNLGVEGKVCTMEAKQCDDGSYVSRTGPDCEFAKCGEVRNGEKLKLRDSTEIKDQREALKNTLETKREEIKKQIETIREEAKQKIEALREGIKNEKDSAKAKIKEERINGRENALQRFDNAVARISDLKDKVNAQITKLEAKLVDVTAAKAFIVTADAKLVDAKTKIAAAHTLLALSINELTVENKATLATLAKDTQALIVDAHLALNNAVKSLKDSLKLKIEADAKVKVETSTTENN